MALDLKLSGFATLEWEFTPSTEQKSRRGYILTPNPVATRPPPPPVSVGMIFTPTTLPALHTVRLFVNLTQMAGALGCSGYKTRPFLHFVAKIGIRKAYQPPDVATQQDWMS